MNKKKKKTGNKCNDCNPNIFIVDLSVLGKFYVQAEFCRENVQISSAEWEKYY